jgi:hypothetical protein
MQCTHNSQVRTHRPSQSRYGDQKNHDGDGDSDGEEPTKTKNHAFVQLPRKQDIMS